MELILKGVETIVCRDEASDLKYEYSSMDSRIYIQSSMAIINNQVGLT